MISVRNLTKRFPGTVAVDDVSFEVERGEVVGFLGPNGAGKTTTMRILAGYLPASGGVARVAGRDVFSNSLEVRKRIGYLPENVPLYPEMRVQEYLRFRANLKGVAVDAVRRRVSEVMEMCGLLSVRKRLIGQLSKGFRQRVGLADALVHEPDLLILDEPTIGLDPNQIRQVRSLIKELAEKHTILLSTHILSEVEMTCRRVLIIKSGRIVAADSPSDLRRRMKGGQLLVADIRGARNDVLQKLSALPHVQEVSITENGEWMLCRLDCVREMDLRSNVFELVVRNGWGLRELHIEHKTLEEAFVELTHGQQRGGGR